MSPAGRHGTGLTRSAAVMATGTALSRLTGLVRVLALIYAVRTSDLADAYNLANTLPNIVVDLVLGGVVSATFIPVFVERLTARSEDEAWDAISAVASVTVVLIGIASLAFLAASPLIVRAMTVLNHSGSVGAERQVATELLVLFVPQLTGYGLIALATALLNARHRFAAPMFAPIANNAVLIGMLLVFGTVVSDHRAAAVQHHRGLVLLLGLGTTAGVVVQAAVMIPSLRRSGLHLRWQPRFAHEAVRAVVRLSGWTVGLVIANQTALIVVLALAARTRGAVSAYTYAYTFFQLPYGVVAVSIMTATTPALAEDWTTGDLAGFRRKLGGALRRMLAVIVPAAAGMVVLGRPMLQLVGTVIGHPQTTQATGTALALLSLGLPGFCIFLYTIRVLQAMQDLRSAFGLYVLENGANVVLALVLAGPAHLGLRGITLSISLAYSLAAVVALGRLHSRVQGLGGDLVGRPLGRILSATAGLVGAAALGANVTASSSSLGLAARLGCGVLAGGGAYVGVAGILGVLEHRRRARTTTPRWTAVSASPRHGRLRR